VFEHSAEQGKNHIGEYRATSTESNYEMKPPPSRFDSTCIDMCTFETTEIRIPPYSGELTVVPVVSLLQTFYGISIVYQLCQKTQSGCSDEQLAYCPSTHTYLHVHHLLIYGIRGLPEDH
jgi:hypothetical protein